MMSLLCRCPEWSNGVLSNTYISLRTECVPEAWTAWKISCSFIEVPWNKQTTVEDKAAMLLQATESSFFPTEVLNLKVVCYRIKEWDIWIRMSCSKHVNYIFAFILQHSVILNSILLKIMVRWNVSPCSLVDIYQRLRGTSYLQL
jgi:hypothetical protein